MDTLKDRLEHVESFAFKPHSPEVNAPLAAHMASEHPERYAQWVEDNTVGDLEDEHYMAHDLLVTEAELLAMLKVKDSTLYPPPVRVEIIEDDALYEEGGSR